MVERLKTFAALILLACLALPGCCSFSKESRQQAAYQKHVQKLRHDRQRELARTARDANRPLREPVRLSEPTQTITLEPQDPETAPAPIVVDGGSGQPAP